MHTSRKANDEVVVYFKDGVPTHFGKLKNDLVISKWGIGLIWKHKLFEMPLSYGDTAKYSDGNIDIAALKQWICSRLEIKPLRFWGLPKQIWPIIDRRNNAAG